MAFIGMRHVVMAKVAGHTPGTAPTYEDGMDVGMAITGNLTITRNNNPLYGDDVIAEDDNGITNMELELGVDDLSDEAQEYMGLVKKVTTGEGTSAVTTYLDTSAPSNRIGIGYIRVRRKAGVTNYQAVWGYAGRFSMNAENSQTKGESIEWQTPTVQGRFEGIDIDGSGDYGFRQRRSFATEAAAAAWLDELADITRT